MRLKLLFELENNELPVQYRKSIISFIKYSTESYNKEFFDRMYHERDNIIKPFTFSVFLSNPTFKKEIIKLSNNIMEVIFSTSDYNYGVNLYNAFNYEKDKKYSLDKNSMVLKRIGMITEKDINSDEISIRFLSPLIVRMRDRERKKDYYYSYRHEEFKNTLKINIREQLKITNMQESILSSFDIVATDYRKTVVKNYEKMIEASLGTYKLMGDKVLLEYLYKAGIGAKRSMGFGLFEIVN